MDKTLNRISFAVASLLFAPIAGTHPLHGNA
jgi:hypothetical protein